MSHELEAELSRLKGEIEAALVVLNAAGAGCPGGSLQDRIGNYVGEMETKLEQAQEAKDAL